VRGLHTRPTGIAASRFARSGPREAPLVSTRRYLLSLSLSLSFSLARACVRRLTNAAQLASMTRHEYSNVMVAARMRYALARSLGVPLPPEDPNVRRYRVRVRCARTAIQCALACVCLRHLFGAGGAAGRQRRGADRAVPAL
jgi:hypothetical protein